ncbi:DUF2528 family protein [Salmonella enterica]|nr:DUF2528 family protein [Salmonella enterica]EIL0034989.1 DUF2528 family protein [Salmonella enterica]
MSDAMCYEITWTKYESKPALIVEIDHSICTDELLHQINNFFIGAEERYQDNNCDITATVLKMMAETCFDQTDSAGYWSERGVVDLVDGNMEGWPPLNGSKGIRILSCDVPIEDWINMEVEEVS